MEAAGPRTLDVRTHALVTVALVYLGLPVLLLAVYLHTPVVWAAAVLLVVALVFAASSRHSPDRSETPRGSISLRWSQVAAIVVLALALATVGGAAGIVDPPWDWNKHNALLHDLTTMPWPVAYEGLANASLVYSFGLHLPAAAVGKVAGGSVVVAHAALLLWIALGFAVLLTLLSGFFDRGRRALWAAVVLVAFGGADLLGAVAVSGDAVPSEWWMMSDDVVLQYSGNVTALCWVPQHAIPSWLIGVLFVRAWPQGQWREGRALLFAVGLSALWSPFAAMGGAVLLGALLLRFAVQRVPLRWRSLWVEVCLGSAVLPVALFLSLTGGGQELSTTGIGVQGYVLFLAVEIGLWVVMALFAGRYRAALVPVLLVLLVLPFLRLGEYNDLAMRASLPALMALNVLAWVGAVRGTAPPNRPVGRIALTVVSIAAVALSVPTWSSEFDRVVGQPPAYEQPWDETVPAFLERLNSSPSIWAQYLVCPQGPAARLLALEACRGTVDAPAPGEPQP
ncbi:hypothetical protein SAMN05660464_1635 [Geodermatophilus dictyosporus]|uniref:Uncharacterized protein n=1 Tax=Geodermatophilus dictyosporus TaxID=1523247 RepID=A0A1I5L9R4_9ACTN|nr:hypothetical protein SAMN05660464_1635 [Geodermatophilus dictyosporus]